MELYPFLWVSDNQMVPFHSQSFNSKREQNVHRENEFSDKGVEINIHIRMCWILGSKLYSYLNLGSQLIINNH